MELLKIRETGLPDKKKLMAEMSKRESVDSRSSCISQFQQFFNTMKLGDHVVVLQRCVLNTEECIVTYVL